MRNNESSVTMNIGSLTEGDIPDSSSVKHNSNVTLTTPGCDTNVGDTVDGDVSGIVSFYSNVNVLSTTTTTSTNPSQLLQYSSNGLDGKELKRIGDTVTIAPNDHISQKTYYGNDGAITIVGKVNGKISNTLKYEGDGYEHIDRHILSGTSDGVRSYTNVGSVTKVGECKNIEFRSDVVIDPKK